MQQKYSLEKCLIENLERLRNTASSIQLCMTEEERGLRIQIGMRMITKRGYQPNMRQAEESKLDKIRIKGRIGSIVWYK